MLKELISVATSLDEKGFQKEADALDVIITKMAEDFGSFDTDPQSEEYFDYEDQDQVERLMGSEADAELLSDLIVGGGPVTGKGAADLKQRLLSVLLKDEFTPLTEKILKVLDGQE
jgi:hypothetical protein